jgi:integrative and conjugative element protein (TIGR02256 family)
VRVWLDERAHGVIEREALRRRLVETGGSLFGYEGESGVVIACAFGPGCGSKHRPRSFIPDKSTTAALIQLVREASEARYRFLGSWHTHPRGAARPSAVDTATAADLSGQADLLLPAPIILIQATRAFRREVELAELRAWRWQTDQRRLATLDIEMLTLEQHFCPAAATLHGLGLGS